MFAWVTWKSYLIIGIATALIVFGLARVAGPGVVSFISGFEGTANAAGLSVGLTSLFTQPVRIMMEGNPIVSIIAGLLWPFTILWLLIILIIIVYAVLVPGLQTAGGTIDGK